MNFDAYAERHRNDEAAAKAGLRRAEPRAVGLYFLGGDEPEENHCRAACYNVHDWGISLACDYGHSAGAWVDSSHPRGSYGGSAFAASLNDLPAGAPFVAA